jgi:hypothetical protein
LNAFQSRSTRIYWDFRLFEAVRASGPELALRVRGKAVTVAQRILEMVIGRLITDEEFRSEFMSDAQAALTRLTNSGLELTRTEIAALLNTDRTLWARTGDAIDPRLQKVSIRHPADAIS